MAVDYRREATQMLAAAEQESDPAWAHAACARAQAWATLQVAEQLELLTNALLRIAAAREAGTGDPR